MRRLALLTLVLALWPAAASAENLEQFGFGARAQGMGGAFTGLSSDGTAAYYNPGGLILSRHLNLTFGFSYADYNLEFDSVSGGKLDSDAERIQPLSAITLGMSTTIPLDIPDRFAFGFALFTPTRGIIDLEARATSSTPEWFSYGARHDRMIAIPAVALKVTEWFSFGLGASVGLSADGRTRIEGSIATPVQTQVDIKLEPSLGFVLGGLLAPVDWFSFGITYRSETSMEVNFPARAVIQGFPLPIVLEAEQFFSPHQVQAGVAANITDEILLSLDVLWVNWSGYDTPFLEVAGDGTVTVIAPVDVDFEDVFSIKVGAEFVATDWLIIRGGYWYASSPVENQDFLPTNLAGSDKHVITFGVGFAFGQAGEDMSEEMQESEGPAQTMDEALIDASFDLDIFFQYHIHTGVSADKAALDPIGNWDADGNIINFGFTLTARF